MRNYGTARTVLYAGAFAGILFGQNPGKVDFGRDVLPLLRQNCISCHGPAQQINGLRLDRRSSVLGSGARRVVPGSSGNSFLYHRLAGTEYGMQMPPTGPLRPEQISLIKTWIDQGAEWPDALANEVDRPPVNPKAVAMVEALRSDDMALFMKAVSEDPKLLNARGPEGSTPFMYAVLYSSAKTVSQLLKKGADPNVRNDANATALMWAVADLEKTRVLLDGGADVNARSDNLRTPLIIAARRPGNAAVVTLLLDRGAKTNPNARPVSESSPLIEAALAGDLGTVEMLIERGADVKAAGAPAFLMAATGGCSKCVDLLTAKNPDRSAYTVALPDIAALGDVGPVRVMLDHGADLDAVDPLGRTPLMYAAGSDAVPLELVKLLVEHGADVNAKNAHRQAGDTGLTVLDLAKLRGNTPVVDYLVKKGAKESPHPAPALKARPENSIVSAIEGSVPLIQRADANFVPKAGCVSCHNNSLGAMAIGLARKAGFRVDEKMAAQQVKANVFGLQIMRDRLHQGFFVPVGDSFGPFLLGYILVGLDAEHYKADINTDSVVMYLRHLQSPDGQWAFPAGDARPPLCSLYIGQTALSMRALQLYAPKAGKADFNESIRRAASWLAKTRSANNDDRGWRVIGLAWAGTDKNAMRTAMQELLAKQRSDGGWSDLDSMESSAYATGKALVALQTAGMPVSDAAYERGVRFLLKTQQEDGSWYVKTRALAFQPFFDAGFPYGFDQWISAAGTSWATMALTLASPPQAATPAHVTTASLVP